MPEMTMKTPQELNELANRLDTPIQLASVEDVQQAAHELRHMAQLQEAITLKDAVIRDFCENEIIVENYASKVLTDFEVHGDSYGVPGICGITETLVAKVQQLRADLHEAAELLQVARFLDRTLWDRRDSFLAKLKQSAPSL